MIIAIDFDGVLTNYKMQILAKKMISEKNDVWIVTKRRIGMDNKDLQKVLDFIRLPMSKVIFTNNKDKEEFLKGINADIFIDNENNEFANLMSYSNVLPLHFNI